MCVAPLQAEIATRDVQIAQAAALEDTLRLQLAAELNLSDAATSEAEDLRGQLAIRDAQLLDAAAREDRIRAELAIEHRRADAMMFA